MRVKKSNRPPTHPPMPRPPILQSKIILYIPILHPAPTNPTPPILQSKIILYIPCILSIPVRKIRANQPQSFLPALWPWPMTLPPCPRPSPISTMVNQSLKPVPPTYPQSCPSCPSMPITPRPGNPMTLPQILSIARQNRQYRPQNLLNSPPFTPTSHPTALLK